MKREYRKPMAKKIDYAFEEQVIARSDYHEPEDYDDPYKTHLVCTWGPTMPMCNVIYNKPTQARGLNQCAYQGDIEIKWP